MNKKIIKKIDKAVDVLGRAMIFTMLLILATEFIILGIFGFKIFYASAQTPPAENAVNPANVPQIAVPVGDFYRECAVCAAKKTAEEQNACYGAFDSTKCFDVQRPENWIGQYVQAWFNYLVGAIGIIAVVMVMWGGIKWIASGGNSSQIEEAKTKIKNAVIGIVLLLGAYTIFKTVNPKLLDLSLPPIEKFAETEEICCQDKSTKIKSKKFECDQTTEDILLDDLECANKTNICKKNTNIPCGTFSSSQNCMGIKPKTVGNICLVYSENYKAKTAFELAHYTGGDTIFVKVTNHPGEKFVFYESSRNPGNFYECGEVNDDKNYIGTYCSSVSNTNCWAQVIEEGAVYEITAPACE